MAEVSPELMAALQAHIEVTAELRAVLQAGRPRPPGILARQMHATVDYDRALEVCIDRRAKEIRATGVGEVPSA
jgi:hypothetical protein